MNSVVCIASGPSLTPDDCALVEQSGIMTIAVNTSWKMAPFCSAIYAGDHEWWHQYSDEIAIPARRITTSSRAAAGFAAELHRARSDFNSGAKAIQWALEQGAKTVLLLGYDCSLKNGTHWHGDHQRSGNPNPAKIRRWQQQFRWVAGLAESLGAEIVNCSRHSEIDIFQRGELLEQLHHCRQRA